MSHYHLVRLSDPGSNSPVELLQTIRGEIQPAAAREGWRPWGVFAGLFGLATNELYLMLAREEGDGGTPALAEGARLQVEERHLLSPTVRPTAFSPPEQPGIYVFRWFSVRNRDVEEIAAMSKEAWVTFEDSFDTEVQGLFADADRTAEIGTMLLVTWYRDLAVWERSRTPPDAARALFQRRHQLTLSARPIATRLLPAA